MEATRERNPQAVEAGGKAIYELVTERLHHDDMPWPPWGSLTEQEREWYRAMADAAMAEGMMAALEDFTLTDRDLYSSKHPAKRVLFKIGSFIESVEGYFYKAGLWFARRERDGR